METQSLSIVVHTYNRPKYLRACLESLAVQISRDFEVVVVCNGALEETYDVIDDFKGRLPVLKIVRLPTNIWSWDDVNVYYREVHKPGLDVSSGKFVLFLSDDDALSKEFVERVLRIFAANSECVAVTGPCINIDLMTRKETPSMSAQDARLRPKLEDGKSLALRALSLREVDRRDIRDPGFGYVIRASLWRDEGLQEAIWDGFENEQYRFLLPHGLVGFDSEATFFWGRHAEQANKLLNNRIGMLRYYAVHERSSKARSLAIWYSRFGTDWAQRLKKVHKETSFPRSLRFLWQSSPYGMLVIIDVIHIMRDPRVIKKVFKTDARESIFWILIPQTLLRLFVALFRRGGKALNAKRGDQIRG
jgi:glycosyltransferase involved in cell wall biosynthesis